jgi:hypothetical protein
MDLLLNFIRLSSHQEELNGPCFAHEMQASLVFLIEHVDKGVRSISPEQRCLLVLTLQKYNRCHPIHRRKRLVSWKVVCCPNSIGITIFCVSESNVFVTSFGEAVEEGGLVLVEGNSHTQRLKSVLIIIFVSIFERRIFLVIFLELTELYRVFRVYSE